MSLKVREREPKSLDEAYSVALRLAAYQRTADPDDRRRQPQRVRGARESDAADQVQLRLEKFLEEQRHWQRGLEERINRQFVALSGPSPAAEGTFPRPPSHGQYSDRPPVICYNCRRLGHMDRQCRQRRRVLQQAEPEDNGPTSEPEEETVPNHTTRVCPVGDLRNAIYIRCTINGRSTLCLRDTGSEVSLVPLSIVQGLPLQPTNRVLLAANATAIQVQGKLNIPVKMCRRFLVSTDFLVSDQMTDAMFGMDWLRRHRCRISFGTGALFVGKRRYPFVKGDGAMWCRRMTVAEEVTLPPRAQCHVPCQMQYRDLRSTADAWMTENREVRPGVHVARMVLGDRDQTASPRVINLGKNPPWPSTKSSCRKHPVEIKASCRN